MEKLEEFIKFIKELIDKLKNIREIENFLDWFKLKLKIYFKNGEKKFPKVGEIWFVRLGKNIGSEQNGEYLGGFSRPCLVIRSFGNVDNVIILPLTKKKKPDYVSYFLDKNVYLFLKFNSYVMLDQVRMISKKRLSGYPLGALSEKDVNKILEKFCKLIKGG